MDYEKKYKEALEGIRELYNSDCDMIRVKRLKRRLKLIFPELKESEDEKIRREIIDFLRLPHHQFVGKRDHEKWIDWLEKQGEQQGKSVVEAWKDMRLEVYQQASGNRHEPNYSDDTTKMFSLNDIDEIIEKISEQKLDDKVEPKFKVGDWIACKELNTARIINIEGDRYEVEFIDGSKGFPHIEWVDRNLHLWTIQDAKDGDVLALISGQCIFLFDGYDKEYCHYSKLTNSFSPNLNYIGFIQHQFVPATKEQRDTLFAKMEESGYEWDAKKKGLVKYVYPDGFYVFGNPNNQELADKKHKEWLKSKKGGEYEQKDS